MIRIPREVTDIVYGGYHHDAAYRGQSLIWAHRVLNRYLAALRLLSMEPSSIADTADTKPFAAAHDAIAERGMASLSPALAGVGMNELELGGGSGLALQLSQLLSAAPQLPVSTDAAAAAGYTVATERTQETLGGHAAVIAIRPLWCKTHNELLGVDAMPVVYPGALFRVREELLDITMDAVSAAGCAGERLTSLWHLLSPAAAAQGAAMREAEALWHLLKKAQASMAVAAGAARQMDSLRGDAATAAAVAGLAQKELWQGTGSANAPQTVAQESRRTLCVAYDASGAAAHTKAAGAAASVRTAANATLLGAGAQAVGAERYIRTVPAAMLLLTNTLSVESAAQMRVTGTPGAETAAAGGMGRTAALTENEASIHGTAPVPAIGEHRALRKYAAMELATGGWDNPIQTGSTVYITQSYHAAQSGDTLEVS